MCVSHTYPASRPSAKNRFGRLTFAAVTSAQRSRSTPNASPSAVRRRIYPAIRSTIANRTSGALLFGSQMGAYPLSRKRATPFLRMPCELSCDPAGSQHVRIASA